jgi:hypothetical protein
MEPDVHHNGAEMAAETYCIRKMTAAEIVNLRAVGMLPDAKGRENQGFPFGVRLSSA